MGSKNLNEDYGMYFKSSQEPPADRNNASGEVTAKYLAEKCSRIFLKLRFIAILKRMTDDG